MMKKIASRLEYDRTLENAKLPEAETKELPVIEVESTELPPISEAELEALPKIEAEVQSNESDEDRQDLKILELKITELEDKFVQLQTELSAYVNKKKNRKKECKKTKVKCKDKDKDKKVVGISNSKSKAKT